jgi:hypothetical protein
MHTRVLTARRNPGCMIEPPCRKENPRGEPQAGNGRPQTPAVPLPWLRPVAEL